MSYLLDRISQILLTINKRYREGDDEDDSDFIIHQDSKYWGKLCC